MQPHEPHAAAAVTAEPSRYDEQVADSIEVLSEGTTARHDSGTYEMTLTYPLPENGLEWFELIAITVDWTRVKAIGPMDKNGWRTFRDMGWDEVYERFDFSASQLIDLELDIDQQ